MKYDKHIFICTNDRGENSTKQSCGSLDIRKEFVSLINASGLKGKVRANKSGCLDLCEQGPEILIYPQGYWYLNVEKRNIEKFFMNLLLVVIKLLSLSQTRNN